MKTPAFWDASALVPLYVDEPTSAQAWRLAADYDQIVWWATEVEVHSALTRLERMGTIAGWEREAALTMFEMTRGSRQEILPSVDVRKLARNLLNRSALRAADSLQLAAALLWCDGLMTDRPFLTADVRLSQAAAAEGLNVILLI